MPKSFSTHLKNLRLFTLYKAAPLLFTEIVIGLILSVFAVKIFDEVAEKILLMQTMELDKQISLAIYSLRNPALTQIMIGVSFLGGIFIIIGASLAAILLVWKQHRNAAISFVLLLVMGLFLNMFLKDFFHRPRPHYAPLLEVSSYSFPSGHAMNSFIFYSTLSFFVYHFTKNKTLSLIVSIVSTILILLIGFSRIYLGVHYPSDVVAGYVAGFFVFVTAIVLQRTLTFYRLTRVEKKK